MFYEDVWVAHLRGVWGQLQAIEEQRKTLDEKEDDVNWLLGDQLVEGVEAGGKSKKLKKHVLQVTGRKLSDSRLNRLMTVSRAVEPCRRQQFLSWSMHAEVAKFEPEVQEKLLEEARDGREEKWMWDAETGRNRLFSVRYKVRGFREHIRHMQDLGQIPRVGKANAKPDAEPKYQTISVRMSLANGNYLEDLAGATRADSVEDMILTLLRRCITENKDEFQAEIAKYHATFPDPKTRRYGRPLPAQRPRRRM